MDMKMFKLQIHDTDEKDIIVLSCRVVSSKRFDKMSKKSKLQAIKDIEVFERNLQSFKTRLQ